jgi:glycosyltransferase involved in cell wall biosynthesis
MFECFKNQTYPKDRIQWIIVDDGTDKIRDLVENSGIKQIEYIEVDKKMTLGAKRNYMHSFAKGTIIVYMDDDDYYPPERISHAVEKLTNDREAMCAGSSEIYIYFKHIQTMYKCGPYGPRHATAGTFAFRKELLKQSRYEDHASLAEEKVFLKNYTIPFVQLDPLKTILVISHEQNTFDKRRLISPDNKQCNESALKPKNFIKSPELFSFYIEEIPKLLDNYKEGSIFNKPEVLAEIDKRDKERQQMHQMQQTQGQTQQVTVKNYDGTTRVLQPHEIIQALQNVTNESMELKKQNELLKETLEQLKNKLVIMEQIIKRNHLQNFFM